MIIEKNKNKKTNPFNFISIFLLISRVHEINVLYQNKNNFDTSISKQFKNIKIILNK
jgi:hypothetical protein